MIQPHNSVVVGKYLVSPLAKQLDDGDYAASVSIRSGRGSTTYDRVMRLPLRFKCRDAAARYATELGVAWAREPAKYLRG